MIRLLRRSLLVVCAVSLSSPLAPAQDTPPAAPAQQAGPRPPRGPRPNPTNIKALPKDITGDQVIKLMREYEGELGVECEFCHARNPETRRNDFASDANPVKDKARIMIRMTDDLNTKYLAQLTDQQVHRPDHLRHLPSRDVAPETFVPKPREQGNRPPAAAPATPPVTPQ